MQRNKKLKGEDFDVDIEDDKQIGVIVHRTDNITADSFLQRPTVKVVIVDSNNGQLISQSSSSEEVMDVKSTKPFDFRQNRSFIPIWEETLIFEEDVSVLVNKQPSKLILFEIADFISTNDKSKRFLRKPKKEDGWVRVSWAFLKPLASDGTLNINKEVRLQLYKVRKNCKISHNTCDLFHLYSSHDWKKYPGTLFVTVKGVKQSRETEKTPLSTNNAGNNERAEESVEQTTKFEPIVYQWSRLPTQSCKIPNLKFKELNTGKSKTHCLKFSHDGKYLACGTQNKIFMFNVLTGEEVRKCVGHDGLLYELDWSSDDELLLSSSADCTACVWNVGDSSNNDQPQVLPHPSFVYTGKWLRGSTSILTGCKDTIIRLWSLIKDEYQLIEELNGHHGFVSSLTTSNMYVFSGDSCGHVFVWKIEGDRCSSIKKISLGEISNCVIDALHLHPGERRLIVTARSRGSFMIDITNCIVLQSYTGVVNLCTKTVPCLSPCGSLFFSYGQNNIVNVWEVETGKHTATYDSLYSIHHAHSETSGCIQYHPFEHLIAFSLFDHNSSIILAKFGSATAKTKQLDIMFYEQKKAADTNVRDNQIPGTNVNKMLTHQVITSGSRPASGRSDGPTSSTVVEQKLDSVIKKIDRVLSANRVIKQFSAESFQKLQNDS